jgi:hypothetical protein
MKFVKFAILLLAALIWLCGLNADIFKMIASSGMVQDGYQFGDLYRLSNLAQFKDPKHTCPQGKNFPDRTNGKKINLFIIGDSFTEAGRIAKEDFNVDSYQYINWEESLHIKPDTSAYNILIIECVERHIREKFASPIQNIQPDSATFVAHRQRISMMHRLDQAFAAKSKESRLDMLLFQNNLIMKVKEWKAAFNYHFFDRVSNDVTLVNKGRDVVFYMDTDTTTTTSSFTPMSDTEADSIAINVMKTNSHARKIGFSQVILSIIPNKVSVVMPTYGKYNNLIERVYGNRNMKMPFINVLPDFRKMGPRSYLKGDSHWTCEGQGIWINKVNNLLAELTLPQK